MTAPGTSPMEDWYGQGWERDRLDEPLGQIEFARTVELISARLPPPPATVADIGGGPGRYTVWLDSLGYSVVHRDLMPLHVEQLRARLAPDSRVDTGVADARHLDLPDLSVDAVLLLGPLYHLQQPGDRHTALREAHRITRPGGLLAAAAISRWAPRLDGYLTQRMYEDFPNLLTAVEQVERHGVICPLTPGAFTGYTHRPQDLRDELTAAHWSVAHVASVEGLAFALSDLAERLATDSGREAVLAAARGIEAVPELVGLGPHLLALALRID
jgi:SAM-dependent methyltransferase